MPERATALPKVTQLAGSRDGTRFQVTGGKVWVDDYLTPRTSSLSIHLNSLKGSLTKALAGTLAG